MILALKLEDTNKFPFKFYKMKAYKNPKVFDDSKLPKISMCPTDIERINVTSFGSSYPDVGKKFTGK